MTELAARYPHHCERCTYLGQFERWDLYHCPQHPPYPPTLVARWAQHPADYDTWNPTLAGEPLEQPFIVAAERARAAGLGLR